MCTVGSVRAPAACTAVDRAISPPSSVTKQLSDMFWALKGATDRPQLAKSRQRPATRVVLPASDPVAWIMMGLGFIGVACGTDRGAGPEACGSFAGAGPASSAAGWGGARFPPRRVSLG